MEEHPKSQTLFAPWRMEYLEALEAKEKQVGTPQTGSGSFLLDYWNDTANDEVNHVIWRRKYRRLLLNGSTYVGGQLRVEHGQPAPTLFEYAHDQRAALWRLVEEETALMLFAIEHQGITTGINQGRAAGAGVPQHLHVHLVPRWNGDINFMTAVGHVRVIPNSLEAMAQRYRHAQKELVHASMNPTPGIDPGK